MPATSSIVSVGRPIIKYNLIVVQPPSNAVCTVFISSSSVTFLLMTSRNLWVPASGANVRPLRRTVFSLSINSLEKPSTRKEGSDTLTFSLSVQLSKVSNKSSIWL